ncbi:Glutaredoxin domain containing protein [Trichuris trichiura]|uniref:Glutaredoxin-related protein 5, mitochondrial n=1 Tax=Trichuris trichiura TaxID=36087 RepID=A0A077ZL64_TRITR|nr:Glutaredoxin domain containing protein [Trichuris trichiura]
MWRLPMPSKYSGLLSVYSLLKNFSTASALTKHQIEALVKSNKVVLFMKGVPEQPMCGFSNLAVQILKYHGLSFKTFNVLEDESLRQGIKDYSDWPTIPQLFIDGEFVGGADIVLELHKNGQLVEILRKAGIKSSADSA